MQGLLTISAQGKKFVRQIDIAGLKFAIGFELNLFSG